MSAKGSILTLLDFLLSLSPVSSEGSPLLKPSRSQSQVFPIDRGASLITLQLRFMSKSMMDGSFGFANES